MRILTSARYSIPYIQKSLHTKYKHGFQYIEQLQSNKPGQYYYLFATEDEKKLHFKVAYWIGPVRNPLGGEFPLIRSRHVRDEFPDAIAEYVINQSPYREYDITDVPMEEVVQNIQKLVSEIDKELDEYDLGYAAYDAEICIVYKGNRYNLTVGVTNEAIILIYNWSRRAKELFPDKNIIVEYGEELMGELGLSITLYQQV